VAGSIDSGDMQRTAIGSALIGDRLWKLIDGTWLEDVFWYALLTGPILFMIALLSWAIYALAYQPHGSRFWLGA
jgi:hypothetical protein